MESLRFLCFFLVCYYFSKKAASLLPNKEAWIGGLKLFLIINCIWSIGSSFISVIGYKFKLETYEYLCHTYVFMSLRFSGELTTLIFVVIGAIITQ